MEEEEEDDGVRLHGYIFSFVRRRDTRVLNSIEMY